MLTQKIDHESVAIEPETGSESDRLERILRRRGIHPLPSEVVRYRLRHSDWQSVQILMTVESLIETTREVYDAQDMAPPHDACRPLRAAR